MSTPDPLREALTALADEWERDLEPAGDTLRALLDAHPAPADAPGVTLTEAERVVLADGYAHTSEAGCWHRECDESLPWAVERIIAARQAPTVLDREAVIGSIHRALAPRMLEVFEAVTGSQAKYDALLDLLTDAVLALPGNMQAPTVALDVETVAEALGGHRLITWAPSGAREYTSCQCQPRADRMNAEDYLRHLAEVAAAADPRRTEAQVQLQMLERVAAAVRDLPTTRTQAFDRGWESVARDDVLALLGAERIEGKE